MTNPTARGLLTGVIVELTAATAYIHFSLGGAIFVLNGAGYVALGAAYAVAAIAPIPIVRRFRWLPAVGLAAYALVTIGAYLVTGPWFSLGWIAKGIEVAIIGLVLADLVASHGGPGSLSRAGQPLQEET
ncbi:MAG: hypothetical protein M3153_07980 [Chloroflexota bacterium]|nr:hypothetical protein [Chloroflexota bacterium]